jgi:hypothetical protein
MKYPLPALLLSVTLFGCTLKQKDAPEKWVDSVGLLSLQQQLTLESLEQIGRTKAAQDSFRNMLIHNTQDHQSAAYRSRFFYHDYGLTFRRPYWDLRHLTPDSVVYVRETLNTAARYLQQLRSISPAAARKLRKTISSGIVYSPWELEQMAGALAQTESRFRNPTFARDLGSLIQRGNLNQADLFNILDDIQTGKITTMGDILDTYGHNILYVPCPQTVTDDSTCLAELLGQILTRLPFYKSHSIESIKFTRMEEWPGHRYEPYTLVRLRFNGKLYSLSYPTGSVGYWISKRVHMEFLPALLHALTRDFNDSLELHVVPSYYLDYVLAVNTNIAGYRIFISKPPKRQRAYSAPGGFFEHELGWGDTLYDNAAKQQYVDNVLSILKRPWPSSTLDSIREHVTWLNTPPTNRTLLQFPATIEVIWADELDDDDPSPYAPVIARLDKISGGRLRGISVAGKAKLHLNFHHHCYTTPLQQGKYLDYGFIRALDQLQNTEDLGGRFYYVPNYFIDEGYTFVFLTTEEYARLQKNPCFTVQPLAQLAKML